MLGSKRLWQTGPAAALVAAAAAAMVETSTLWVMASHRFAGAADVVAFALAAFGVLACAHAALLAAWVVGAQLAEPLGWLIHGWGLSWPTSRAVATGAVAAPLLGWLLDPVWSYHNSPWVGAHPALVTLGTLTAWVAVVVIVAAAHRVSRRRGWRVGGLAAVSVALVAIHGFNACYLPYRIDFAHLRLAICFALLAMGTVMALVSAERLARLRVVSSLALTVGMAGCLLSSTPEGRATATLRSRGLMSRCYVAVARGLRSPEESLRAVSRQEQWLRIATGRSPQPPVMRSPSITPAARVRGVIWISLDALRTDHAHSVDLLPAFAAFARTAVDYRRAYTPFVETWYALPAIAQSQTFPATVQDERAAPTLPALLQDNGVHTAAAFDLRGYKPRRTEPRIYEQGYQRLERDASAASAERLLDVAASLDEPFFIWIHTLCAHPPRLGPFERRLVVQAERVAFKRRQVRRACGPWLVQVLAAVARQPEADAIAVFLFADHGEGEGEHGRFGHAYPAYEEIARIPLAIRLPSTTPRAVDHLVSSIDLAPTAAALLGVSVPATFEGRSLVDGERTPERAGLLIHDAARRAQGGINRALGAAVVDGKTRWKLLHSALFGHVELYDLAADPGELRNRAADEPQVLARLLRLEAELVSATGPLHRGRP